MSFKHLCLAGAIACSALSAQAECMDNAIPLRGPENAIRIDTAHIQRALSPEFFGFNLEWVVFQMSLWNRAERRVAPEVVQWLRPFQGAVYRYPGGTVSNYFEWSSALSPPARRSPQKAVDWHAAIVPDFGPSEYLSFVREVGGRPWIVLNLFGNLDGEVPQAELLDAARQTTAFFREQQANGMPAVFRYELGNELDRDRFRWPPAKYVEVARQFRSAVAAIDSKAAFVTLTQDWDASKELWGIDATTYNKAIAQGMGSSSEFAAHLYYDGRPWGPPIPAGIRQLCRSQRDASPKGGAAASFWITEHARTPEGTPAEARWKKNLGQTHDLGAAISVADMMIALAQQEGVRGAFLHSLHAIKGPWPLFHSHSPGATHPSAVYWALRILRDNFAQNVLPTVTTTTQESTYEGKYDIRAVALTDDQHSRYIVWLVNRSLRPLNTSLQLAALAGKRINVNATTLADTDPSASNAESSSRLQPVQTHSTIAFGKDGVATIAVPGNSVQAIVLAPMDKP